jgi:hypothetical protein
VSDDLVAAREIEMEETALAVRAEELERPDFRLPCPCCCRMTIGEPCHTGQDANERRLSWWSQCGYCKTKVRLEVDRWTSELMQNVEKSDHGLTIEALRDALLEVELLRRQLLNAGEEPETLEIKQ